MNDNPTSSPDLTPGDNPLSKREKKPGNDLVVFKRSYLYVLLVPLAFLIGLGVGYLIWGSQLAEAQKAAAAAQPGQQAVKRYDVSEDDDPSIGPANAPLTIIEFSDYECPFCRRWYTDVFLKIRQDYPDKVRIVYRDYPLTSIHPEAEPAAVAADCANEQNAYWEYHNELFTGEELSQDAYIQFAQNLGLDMDKFKACLASGKYTAEVQGDLDYASNLGVRSTPTFFLNGIPIVGAQPYETFKQIIDQELAGKIPK